MYVEALGVIMSLVFLALFDSPLLKSLSTFAVVYSLLVIGEAAAVALLVADDARRTGRRVGWDELGLLGETVLAAVVMIASAVLFRPHISCFGLVTDVAMLTWILPFVAAELYMKG